MMTDMIESAAMIDRQREFARQMRAIDHPPLEGEGRSRSERGGVANGQKADQRFQTESGEGVKGEYHDC
jgi:hypothetical protein